MVKTKSRTTPLITPAGEKSFLLDHIQCKPPCVEPTSASSAATLDDLSPNMPDPKQDMGSFRLSAQLHPAPRPNRGPITSESPPKCALVTPNPCQVPSRSFVQCLSPLSPMFGLAGASQSPSTHFPAFSIPHPHPAMRRYGNLCPPVDVNRLTTDPLSCAVLSPVSIPLID